LQTATKVLLGQIPFLLPEQQRQIADQTPAANNRKSTTHKSKPPELQRKFATPQCSKVLRLILQKKCWGNSSV